MILTVIGLTAGLFIAGTAAHELTHYAVARATGCQIEGVQFNHRAQAVRYRAPTPGVDSLVRVAPVLCSVPLVAGVLLVANGRGLVWHLASGAFLVAYLPRSRTDWQPVRRLI